MSRQISVSELADLSGMNRRTVRKRISDLESQPGPRNAVLYDSAQALRAVYLDGQKESSADRRNNAQAENLEFDLAVKRGEYELKSQAAETISRFVLALQRWVDGWEFASEKDRSQLIEQGNKILEECKKHQP
ncbi:MAG: hypothetical protein AAF514_12440 [Verrucomicrobiota bacterium]